MHRKIPSDRDGAFFALGDPARRDGFTVAEVVVAIAILFVVAMGVMGALAFSAAASRGNASRETALAIADQQVERARNMPFDDVGTIGGNPGGKILTPDSTTAPGYIITTDIVWAPDPLNASKQIRAKKMSVTVSWTNPWVGHVSVESSIVGKSEINNVGDVKVTVVDDDTNLGLSGASVTIQPSLGNPSTGSTGSDGAATFLNVASGSLKFTDGTRTGYKVDIATLNGTNPQVAVNTLNTWTIRAYRLSTGIVIVKDTNGNLLQGVSVKLTCASLNTSSGPAVSDAQGKATFGMTTSLGLRKGTWTVAGTAAGYVQSSSTNLVITAGAQTVYDQANGTSPGLVMSKLPMLRVTVKNEEGVVVPGATLGAIGGVSPSGVTDANGLATYTFPGTGGPWGPYTITASMTGYINGTGSSGTIAVGTDPAPVTIILGAPMVLTVTVKDTAGQPVSGVTLSAVTGGILSGATDDNGQATYTFTASRSSANFTATKTGYATASGMTGTITIGVDPPPVTITLHGAPRLVVTVKDQWGNPIAGAALTAINGVTPPTTDSNGRTTYVFTARQTATNFTASKTFYTSATATSLLVDVDQTLSQSVTITQNSNLKVTFTFGRNDASSYTVYIYTTKTGTTEYAKFTATKPGYSGGDFTQNLTLPPGAIYYLSTSKPCGANSVPSPLLTSTSQLTVSMTKSN